MGFFSKLKNRARQPLMAPSLPMTMPMPVNRLQPLAPRVFPRRPNPRFFGGGLESIYARLPEDRRQIAQDVSIPDQMPAAPVPFEMDRVPFERPGFVEGEDVDINRIIADQGAREGISPAERKAQSIKNFLLKSNRIISDRDAELYGMGLLSFEDVMRKVESARQTDLANEQRRNAIADQGRTLSNMDRNLLQQEQLFFPKEEKSFRDFQRAFKGTRLGDFLSFIPDQMQVADYMNYKREQGFLDDLLDDLEKKN